MSLAKQVGLLAAGCQPWNTDVIAASGDRFAYCATLAIYIYQLDRQSNEFKLHSIMAQHKKTISTIAWNPRNPDIIASASADNQVIVYNVSEQKVVAKLENTKGTPVSIGWCLHERDCVAFVSGRGPLLLWNHVSNTLLSHREAQNFMSDVCQFRWHPKKLGKVAFGHNDGSLSLICPGQRPQKHVFRPDNVDGTDEEDPVTALEWDPLSIEYLLLSNTHNGVRLVDSDSITVIMCFQLPSAAAEVHTLAWISTAPGMFITGDTHTGVMRLWNVSKSTPIENIRLKKTGFHALQVFSTSLSPMNGREGGGDVDGSTTTSHVSSTSSATPPAGVSVSGRFALPSAHAVCTFLDGGVGLYDLGQRRWNFIRDMGHIETIFDCKFKPDNPDQLATGSFDGTIKIWDVNTLKAVASSPGNEGVIYCLSWAPADLHCLVASTSRNGAFIWDVTKGKIIRRFHEHGKSPVYSVAWNQKDSSKIASCGGDSYCFVRQVDGKLVAKYKHPGSVFGCDWSPHNKDMLVTGCEDKCVRIFYLATTSDQPLKVFSGHKAKVFHVRWSPLREGILASGSDDCTIRIWDYTQDCCVCVLEGHTGPVRGLLWNTEIPYMLVTGSWDYSMRVWDTRDGACIDTVLDHGADVYGLTCHPQRPFVLCTSSRDSTVRIWSLTPLVQPLEISIISQRPWQEIIASTEHAIAHGSPPILAGKASRDLKQYIDKLQGDCHPAILRLFSKFFASPLGACNLWELVTVVQGLDDSLLSPSYSKGIMHHKHLTKYRASEAQELELVRVAKIGGGIGTPTKEERLKQAANIHLRLGNLQRYCELLVDMGQWEKALSVSPGVSQAYWRDLAARYSQYLLQEENEAAIPYCVALGQSAQLVKFFTSRGQLQDALMTATASYEGGISATPGEKFRQRSSRNGVSTGAEETKELLERTHEEMAESYYRDGQPVMAACCYLSVDNHQKCLCALIRGGEYELAVSVGLALSTVPQLTCIATEFLSRRCERFGKWDLAVSLLKILPEPSLLLAQLCSRCAASMAEINDLHTKAGFPSMDDCLSEAQSLQGDSDRVFECVKYYLLSTSPLEGLQIGLTHIKGVLGGGSWNADDVWNLLLLMASIQTEKLQHQKAEKLRQELLILCAYLGCLVAIRMQYNSIVPALFRQTIELMSREGWDLPLSVSLVSNEAVVWQVVQDTTARGKSSASCGLSPEQESTWRDMLRKCGEETSPLGVGAVCVSGSQLPSHSDVHYSCINKQRIQGQSFFLEDGKSVLSINDAVMWASVNPFSPLSSGVRINPF